VERRQNGTTSLRVNEKLAVSQQQRKPHHYDEQCFANQLTDLEKNILYFTAQHMA